MSRKDKLRFGTIVSFAVICYFACWFVGSICGACSAFYILDALSPALFILAIFFTLCWRVNIFYTAAITCTLYISVLFVINQIIPPSRDVINELFVNSPIIAKLCFEVKRMYKM